MKGMSCRTWHKVLPLHTCCFIKTHSTGMYLQQKSTRQSSNPSFNQSNQITHWSLGKASAHETQHFSTAISKAAMEPQTCRNKLRQFNTWGPIHGPKFAKFCDFMPLLAILFCFLMLSCYAKIHIKIFPNRIWYWLTDYVCNAGVKITAKTQIHHNNTEWCQKNNIKQTNCDLPPKNGQTDKQAGQLEKFKNEYVAFQICQK